MGANVYANGMEVSGKATPHNVIASMPDVCLSPPSPPAGPIPIPYPNFAQSSDLTDGSKTVTAGGKEISLKGKSKYKKSTGDEAATRTFGGGVISHNITGPVKHKAGSFDVMVEGSCVVRNLDLTTGNHSNPGDGCANVDTAGVAPGLSKDPQCEELKEANDDRRQETKQTAEKTTITHAKVKTPRGAAKTVWSCSSSLLGAYRNGNLASGYVSGLERVETRQKSVSDTEDEEGRKGKKASNLCPEAQEQLKKNNGRGKVYTTTKSSETPHTSHTESRVLESLFASGTPPPGTSVTFAIQVNKFNKKTKKWKKDDNPCPRCRKLICAAEKCGIKILICDKNNNAQDVRTKTGKDCPGDE